jgi:hypothetical protein
MIERRRLRSGALARTVKDERDRVVFSASVRLPMGERPAELEWAVNPRVDSLSALMVGQIQEALGELAENLWAIDQLHRER